MTQDQITLLLKKEYCHIVMSLPGGHDVALYGKIDKTDESTLIFRPAGYQNASPGRIYIDSENASMMPISSGYPIIILTKYVE
jgi:ABC-type thiamine transport system ATPase subunit